MKPFFKPIIALVIISAFVSCEKDEDLRGVPDCVKEIIQEIKSEPISNPPRSIWQYEYKGKVVYYIPPMCCDIPSRLIDSECNLICSPDGGLTGKGDGLCPDFSSEQRVGKLIWKDTRN